MIQAQKGLSRRERLTIIRDRDGIFCFHPDCGKPFKNLTADIEITEGNLLLFEDITFDHWYPRSLGGTWDVENLRLMHKRCNALKGDTVPNEDGTITPPARQNAADRRNAARSRRVEVCKTCNSGRALEYGDVCADCGSGPMPLKFPNWAQMRPKDCDHDMFHCWACVLGIYERRAAIHDVVNSSELDPD